MIRSEKTAHWPPSVLTPPPVLQGSFSRPAYGNLSRLCFDNFHLFHNPTLLRHLEEHHDPASSMSRVWHRAQHSSRAVAGRKHRYGSTGASGPPCIATMSICNMINPVGSYSVSSRSASTSSHTSNPSVWLTPDDLTRDISEIVPRCTTPSLPGLRARALHGPQHVASPCRACPIAAALTGICRHHSSYGLLARVTSTDNSTALFGSPKANSATWLLLPSFQRLGGR